MRALVYSVIAAGVLVLVRVSVPLPPGIDVGRILFWTVITIVLAVLPVRLPGGMVAHTTTAPLIACAFDPGLANPFAICWIAFIGTIEMRDLKRELPLYATLYNRFDYLLAAYAAYLVVDLTRDGVRSDDPIVIVVALGWRA